MKFLAKMGDDLDVANSARVSFRAFSRTFSVRDKRLLHFLARFGHWSPYSHCYMKFWVRAPIFVARQLQKHTVGLAWNEVSRRYVDYEPELYYPEEWRARPVDKKQGSSEYPLPALVQEASFASQYAAYAKAIEAYNSMIQAGVAPEQARMVLPQSAFTEWIWSGSLYAFARVCKQRLAKDAQKETADVVQHIRKHMAKHFPVSTEALLNDKDANA